MELKQIVHREFDIELNVLGQEILAAMDDCIRNYFSDDGVNKQELDEQLTSAVLFELASCCAHAPGNLDDKKEHLRISLQQIGASLIGASMGDMEDLFKRWKKETPEGQGCHCEQAYPQCGTDDGENGDNNFNSGK